MNFFKTAATVLASVSLFASLSAPAQATKATTYHRDHVELSRAIQAQGVRFYVNPEACNEVSALGWYNGKNKVLVVCQENNPGNGQMVTWTSEDYDTLRHEAQHLIQDCMDNKFDSQLSPVYKDPIGLAESTLSRRHIQWIIGTYREHGASDKTLVLELEAFSVAARDNALEQTADVLYYCQGVN